MITKEILDKHLIYDRERGIFHRGDGVAVGKIATNGYRQIYVARKLYMAHRMAWLTCYGVMPTGQIDHINRVRDDNRIANLREVTATQNQENMLPRDRNSTGFRGIRLRGGKYLAEIKVNKKSTHLGTFSNLGDAIKARMEAENRVFSVCDYSPIYSRLTHGEIVRVRNHAVSFEAPGTIVVHTIPAESLQLP